jgi:hypothetical protein
MKLVLVPTALLFSLAGVAAGQCIQPEDSFYPLDALDNLNFGDTVRADGDFVYASGSAYASNSGRVYIFQRTALEWSEATRLDPPHFDPNGQFGWSLDKNGPWLAISQPMKDGAGYEEGRVEIYSGDGSSWTPHSTLASSDIQAYDEFGSSLSLDGDTLIVGAKRSPGPSGPGALYVFDWDGVSWNQTQKLVPLDAQDGDLVGVSCVIRGDWLAVGATSHDMPFSAAGAVYVFERTAGVWSQQAKLSASDPQLGSRFGGSLALHNNTLIVGCNDFGGNGYFSVGKAYVFIRQSGLWTEQAQLLAPNVNNFRLGSSVAFDGNYAAIGAPGANTGRGAIQLYERVGTQWSLVTQLNGSGQTGSLGTSVALDDDTLCGGAPTSHTPYINSGQARIWSLTPTFGTYCTAKTNSQGCVPQISIASAPSVLSAAPCLVTATSILDNKSGLFVYCLAGPIASPFQGGLLCVMPPLRRTPLQTSGGSGGCDGVFNFDFRAWMSTGFDTTLVAGARVWGQFWSRDPGFAPPNNTNLTDAAYFLICP